MDADFVGPFVRLEHPDLTVLSLGAGVQSSTLLLMAVQGELDRKPDAAIFADTGWEPAAVYRHLEWLKRQVEGIIPVYVVSIGNIRADSLASKHGKRFATLPFHVANLDGEHAMLRRQCTREYKITPITRKIRELLGVEPGRRVKARVEQWFGISLDEVYRMKQNRQPWVTNRYPLIEKRMDRASCLLWLERNGYPRPPKSAYIGCPFHHDGYWRDMKLNRPEEWADAVEYDRAIRRGLRGVLQEAYLHSSLQPLDQVDLATAHDRGQLDFFEDGFLNECEGMCGI